MQEPRFSLKIRPQAGVEMVLADTEHHFGKHTHDQFGIGFILRGAQRSSSQSGLVEAVAGDIITVNPQEVHDGTPLSDGGRAWRMLYLDAEVMQCRVAELEQGGTRVPMEFERPQIRDGALAQLFERQLNAIDAAMALTPGWTLPVDESLLLLLRALLRPATGAPSGLHQSGIARVKAAIDAQPAQVWALADLAREAELSPYQLIRHFDRATGLTPHAYILQRRLQMARRMILQGHPLGEVAAASGFADQSHLTRHFVRSLGLSPGVYARAVSGAVSGPGLARNFVQDPAR